MSPDPSVDSWRSCVPTNTGMMAHRRPTKAVWQRWAPKICARYKSVPARVLIAEMTAEGLLVTEKMFRDRLKGWGKNDKNRRVITSQTQSAIQPTNDRDQISTRRGSRHQIAYHNSSQSEPHTSSIPGPLRVPEQFRSLQQALKSMQNWQNHFQDAGPDQMEILQHTDSFYFLLREISVALRFNRSDLSMCGQATRRLREASAAFQKCLGPMCTPIAVLSSIQLILRIMSRRDTDKWYESTSKFLLQIVGETLPGLHPTTLLLQVLLLQNHTSEGLALIYQVGWNLMQRCYTRSTAIDFRLDFVSAALDVYPDAKFASDADVIGHTAMYRNSFPLGFDYNAGFDTPIRVRDELSIFHSRCTWEVQGRYHHTLPRLPSHLTTMQERGTDYYAWRILCNSQRMQCGFAGEEISQLNAHTLMAAMSDPGGGPKPLSILQKLHLFYKEHDLVEQCQALRLDYPEVIEL